MNSDQGGTSHLHSDIVSNKSNNILVGETMSEDANI